MLRFLLITALVASLFLQVREGLVTWQRNPLPPAPEPNETQAAQGPETITLPVFHQPPPMLPEVRKGYLFNAERNLEAEASGEEGENGGKTAREEPQIDFDTVTFIGSIIAGDKRKALISYSDQPQPQAVAGRALARIRRRPGDAGQPPPGQVPGPAAGGQKYQQLVVGDDFNGYKVSEIGPDKIVFARDEDKLVKLLDDPAKKRVAGQMPGAPAQGMMQSGAVPGAMQPGGPRPPAGPISVGVAPDEAQEELQQQQQQQEQQLLMQQQQMMMQQQQANQPQPAVSGPMGPGRQPPAAARQQPATGSVPQTLRRRLPQQVPPQPVPTVTVPAEATGNDEQ